MCVKGKVLVHKDNVSNNNMITEIKDNKITNIENKAMNDITGIMIKENH